MAPLENPFVYWGVIAAAVLAVVFLVMEYYNEEGESKDSFITIKKSDTANIEDVEYADDRKFLDGEDIKNLNIKGVKKSGDDNG